MDLNRTLIFLTVAQAGSFTKAAEDLGITKSKVSRQVKELEKHLEIQLFHRTTRQISLTQMGLRFYQSCEPLVAQLKKSEQMIKSQKMEPSGTLKITFPPALGVNLFSRITSEFIKKFPKVQLEILLSDGSEDLIGKGIDCAIRGGVLEDSSIICRHLFSCERGIFASPEYLEKAKEIRELRDLNSHSWVSFINWRQNKMKLVGPDGAHKVSITQPVIQVNSILYLHEVLVGGSGLGILPSFISNISVKSGSVVRVLPEYRLEDIDFYLVYPNSSYISPALQAFKEFCYESIGSSERLKERIEIV